MPRYQGYYVVLRRRRGSAILAVVLTLGTLFVCLRVGLGVPVALLLALLSGGIGYRASSHSD